MTIYKKNSNKLTILSITYTIVSQNVKKWGYTRQSYITDVPFENKLNLFILNILRFLSIVLYILRET